MIFLTPLAALLAALLVVPALVALYFLKLRRRESTVSSTLLWKRAIQDLEVNSPFQRLRKNWLLLLQLLTLAALLIALARPVLDGGSVSGKRVVILLDRSASMNATDVSPSRLDEGKRLAGEVAEAAVRGGGVMGWLGLGGSGGGYGVSGASGVMLVSFGGPGGAQVIAPFTSDPSAVRGALEGVEPGDGTGGLGTALGLVEPYAREAQARGGDALVVYVISDGRVGPINAASLAGAELRYLRVGSAESKNTGIASLSARRDYRTPERVRLFVRLVNSGAVPSQGMLTVRVDGQVVKTSPFAVPAATPLKEGESGGAEALTAAVASGDDASAAVKAGSDGLGVTSLEFELSMASEGLVEVVHDVADALKADDKAAIWIGRPRRLGVLVVTEGNAFLLQAVRASGAGQVKVMSPSEFEATGAKALADNESVEPARRIDVAVFDRYSPRVVPPVPSIYFAGVPPVPGVSLVSPTSPTTRPGGAAQPSSGGLGVVLDWRRDHPLLRQVNLGDLVIEGAARLAVPEGGQVLAVGMKGPLMARVAVSGKNHLMTSFSLLKSNWPLQVSFPVFVANALEWLSMGASGEVGVSYQPGESPVLDASLPAMKGAVSTLSGQEGGAMYVLVSPAGPSLIGKRSQGQVYFSPISRVGVYRPRRAEGGGGLVVPANLSNPLESDLRPAAALPVGRGAAVASESEKSPVRREVWRWFAWAALGLLVIEWAVWSKR